jgi:hypothetical protein
MNPEFKAAASSKDCCHWACCQSPRVKGSSLCQTHINTSLKLGLRVWPGPIDEQGGAATAAEEKP